MCVCVCFWWFVSSLRVCNVKYKVCVHNIFFLFRIEMKMRDTQKRKEKYKYTAVTTTHGEFGYVKLTSWNDMLCLWYDTWDVYMTQKKLKQSKISFVLNIFIFDKCCMHNSSILFCFFFLDSFAFTGLESCHVSKCLLRNAVKWWQQVIFSSFFPTISTVNSSNRRFHNYLCSIRSCVSFPLNTFKVTLSWAICGRSRYFYIYTIHE